MILDPDKLDRVRDVMDLEVADRVLRLGVARLEARIRIAEELRYDLDWVEMDGWHIVTAVSFDEQREFAWVQDLGAPDEAWRREKEARERRQVQATTPEAAETAVLLRLLDPALDLGMDADRQVKFYNRDVEWTDVWRARVNLKEGI